MLEGNFQRAEETRCTRWHYATTFASGCWSRDTPNVLRRHFGVTRDTVAQLLAEPAEPRERRYSRAKPVQEAALPHIQHWLQEKQRLARWAPKQRWTARRMWQELRTQGIAIGESTVRELVREQRQGLKPVYLPLDFAPGERAEFDFGYEQANLNGQVVQLPFLAGRLRFSGAMFCEVFPTERQEAFLLGQRHAFEFWGRVTRLVVYDNLKPAVLKIHQGHRRLEQEAFRHFHSVYRFEALFASVRAGWEKGSVENLVGYARRTWRPSGGCTLPGSPSNIPFASSNRSSSGRPPSSGPQRPPIAGPGY